MADTRAIGYEGNWAAPTNHGGIMRSWSLDTTMVESDVTGFGDTWRAVRGGIFGGTGSAEGVPRYGTTNTAPGTTNTDRRTGVELTLTQATGCTFVGTAILTSIAMGSDKVGDASLSFTFTFTGAIVETWATS